MNNPSKEALFALANRHLQATKRFDAVSSTSFLDAILLAQAQQQIEQLFCILFELCVYAAKHAESNESELCTLIKRISQTTNNLDVLTHALRCEFPDEDVRRKYHP